MLFVIRKALRGPVIPPYGTRCRGELASAINGLQDRPEEAARLRSRFGAGIQGRGLDEIVSHRAFQAGRRPVGAAVALMTCRKGQAIGRSVAVTQHALTKFTAIGDKPLYVNYRDSSFTLQSDCFSKVAVWKPTETECPGLIPARRPRSPGWRHGAPGFAE
jgi:hypothetical protein